MVEELEECEILWPHEMMIKCHDNTTPFDQDIISHAKPSAHEENKNKKEKKECSKPMEIQRGHSWSHGAYKHKFDNDNEEDKDFEDDDYDDDDDDDDDDKGKVPPHVVVARRFTDRMVYSVCTGNGRTLKGRDLRNVRDSILRMTGFLER
ncbi:Senescence regulator S40 protein [Dioscorea alata]|uniref:Senescence regulator S40 protein n=1 Tax=Dioscorea alata TaxID=55571 RepID=A0ACB7WER6_DIOAL|nr:Senescence regulator S40 protein [Dioscorea alata]